MGMKIAKTREMERWARMPFYVPFLAEPRLRGTEPDTSPRVARASMMERTVHQG